MDLKKRLLSGAAARPAQFLAGRSQNAADPLCQYSGQFFNGTNRRGYPKRFGIVSAVSPFNFFEHFRILLGTFGRGAGVVGHQLSVYLSLLCV